VPSLFEQKIIREGTPRDAKVKTSQEPPYFAFLGVASRIVWGFGRTGIGA